MLPEWLSGCGGSCAGSRPGGLRDDWLAGWNSCGLPACRDCGAPVSCGSGCSPPVGWGHGCNTPLGWGWGAPMGWGWPGWNSGCNARRSCSASNCSCGTSDCTCGYRWCDCPDCNPLGGYGDGPCGGYISYWDRFYGRG